LLASDLEMNFDSYFNNTLFSLTENSVDLYDPTPPSPSLLSSVEAVRPNCPAWLHWEKERAVGHFLGVNSLCYFQIDLSDPSNIQYSVTLPFEGLTGSEVRKAEVSNSIMFFPGPYGNGLHIIDVCDIDHFRKIGRFDPVGFIRDIALVDETLFMAFGGFIASYDISAIEPCLILGSSNVSQRSVAFNIFPNPSAGYFDLLTDFDVNAIRIVNLQGQVVFTDVSQYAAGNQIHIEPGLTAGVYIIQMDGQNQVYSSKLVVVE
jgi:hypothetical protein